MSHDVIMSADAVGKIAGDALRAAVFEIDQSLSHGAHWRMGSDGRLAYTVAGIRVFVDKLREHGTEGVCAALLLQSELEQREALLAGRHETQTGRRNWLPYKDEEGES